MASDPLPIDFYLFAKRQPDVADDPSVVPPVVPHRLGIRFAHGKARNRSLAHAIIDLDRQIIYGVDVRSNVQRVGGIASLVSSDRGSIQPDPRRIKRRSEVQLYVQV